MLSEHERLYRATSCAAGIIMRRMALEGGCFCGGVRYRATGAPLNPLHCHCADCRRASGAPFVSWVTFGTADFAFVQGTPASFRYEGRVRTFCGRCGTPLTFQVDDAPDQVDVTIGSLDRPEDLAPRVHVWASDRLPWIRLADGLPTVKRPGAPAVTPGGSGGSVAPG
jgi:hypothetical protein